MQSISATGSEDTRIAVHVHKPIDATSPPALVDAFSEACERHGISADDDGGVDLTTVLWHAFGKGFMTKDALATFLTNLIGK